MADKTINLPNVDGVRIPILLHDNGDGTFALKTSKVGGSHGPSLLLEDGVSYLLLEDGVSRLLLEANN